MGHIFVRNVPDDVKMTLKRRAAARGISMEADVREVLNTSALGPGPGTVTPEKGLGTLSRELFGSIGFTDDEFQRVDFSLRPVDFGDDKPVP